MSHSTPFPGFSSPDDEGFTRIPHDFFEVCSQINNVAELKVILYIARHTWGFQEYSKWKRFSVNELMHGRRSGGKRMDSGTGLSEMSVRHGLEKAVYHGYLVCGVDNRDLARITKYYYLKMHESEEQV
jgi:hypothetical protein